MVPTRSVFSLRWDFFRLLRRGTSAARIRFTSDGSFHPFVDGVDDDSAAVVGADAAASAGKQPWRLEYEKEEKRGTKLVADLKVRPRYSPRSSPHARALGIYAIGTYLGVFLGYFIGG